MSLTALTTFIVSMTMIGSWMIIGIRMRRSGSEASRQVVFLRRFFLNVGIFTFCMFLPNLWLNFEPDKFPLYMAIGYTFGHIFLFVGCTEMARLFFSMVPKLSAWDKSVLIIGILYNIIATIVTAATMIFGTQPAYDYGAHVVLFNASTATGVLIAVLMLMTVLPPAILFVRNGIRNYGNRTRSLLLGIGMIVMIVGGPLHDNAKTDMMYMAADVLTITSVILISSGVLYRYEEKLATARILKHSSPSVS